METRAITLCFVIWTGCLFQDMEGHTPSELYRMVINEVEKPLLESVMKQVRGNQSRAAEMLGLNRSTLRKKLQLHNL